MIFFLFFATMAPFLSPRDEVLCTETYRMPGWITVLLAISYSTVSLVVWGTGGADMIAWFQGKPSNEGALVFWVWCGITALEGFLLFALLRAPFTWSVSENGIHLRFGIWKNRRISWDNLRQVEVIHLEPWDAGGYGIKYGPHGWTYAFFEGTGIRLDFADARTKSVCFAFANPTLGAHALRLIQIHVPVTDPGKRIPLAEASLFRP